MSLRGYSVVRANAPYLLLLLMFFLIQITDCQLRKKNKNKRAAGTAFKVGSTSVWKRPLCYPTKPENAKEAGQTQTKASYSAASGFGIRQVNTVSIESLAQKRLAFDLIFWFFFIKKKERKAMIKPIPISFRLFAQAWKIIIKLLFLSAFRSCFNPLSALIGNR